MSGVTCSVFFFFFQAEDGIRDLVRSRGLGDVYKRQVGDADPQRHLVATGGVDVMDLGIEGLAQPTTVLGLSLIHI
mgnify:CR=1 FL=1